MKKRNYKKEDIRIPDPDPRDGWTLRKLFAQLSTEEKKAEERAADERRTLRVNRQNKGNKKWK